MVVDLPAPFGPMKPRSSPRFERERDVDQRVDGAMATTHQPLQRAEDPGIALGNAVRLRQPLDEDLRHLTRYARRASLVSPNTMVLRPRDEPPWSR